MVCKVSIALENPNHNAIQKTRLLARVLLFVTVAFDTLANNRLGFFGITPAKHLG